MNESPLSESSAIVVVGLRNAGKSSLVNAIFEKEVSIVSAMSGTTTDPVVRKMELPGWGAVALVDTAGVDDEGELGQKRVEKTEARIASAAAAVFATPGNRAPEEAEIRLLSRLRSSGKPFLIALTHADLARNELKRSWLSENKLLVGEDVTATKKNEEASEPIQVVSIDCLSGKGAADLRRALAGLSAQAVLEAGPLDGLVVEGDHLLLVAPIDLAAPKGRLIQPQVETIRDALDKDCTVTVVKERELYDAYRSFSKRPRLVITDSQAFSKVAADIPEDQPLTSFSILFARKKGELAPFLRGLDYLEHFPSEGRVFVLEACSHHRGADDIASVKIPRLFGRLVNPRAQFHTIRRLPEDLKKEDMVIHCAGCMMTGAAMRVRMEALGKLGAPVTNYGLFLAWANGLLPRAIEPFPEFPALWPLDRLARNGDVTRTEAEQRINVATPRL